MWTRTEYEVSEPATCARRVRYMCARANLGVVREEGARDMCVGRKLTYLHRHCIVDEAVTVDWPSRRRVFGANDIAHNVWCLWLVLCRQTFVIQHLRPYWGLKLLINCAYLLTLVHATRGELPQ